MSQGRHEVISQWRESKTKYSHLGFSQQMKERRKVGKTTIHLIHSAFSPRCPDEMECHMIYIFLTCGKHQKYLSCILYPKTFLNEQFYKMNQKYKQCRKNDMKSHY